MKDDSLQPHHRHLEKSLADKVAFLRQPANYPDCPREVQVIETHMAWVFLTERFVYKLKKPIFRPDQNFSTIDARHRDHKMELSLNQRLAENIYLSLEALRVDGEGRMSLTNDGNPCDWLLKMRRLPTERMLDQLLQTGQVNLNQATAIGRRLGLFYSDCSPVAISFAEYKNRFKRGIGLNREIVATESDFRTRIETVAQHQLGFMEDFGRLLDCSLKHNRVIECHGDLRPEHVCLQEHITIIDCLQFFRDYRLMDFFDDAGYLALECERSGNPQFGEHLLQAVSDSTNHPLPRNLVHFYQSYRASVRARLALLHLVYRSSDNRDKWRQKAAVYLDLSMTHIGLAGKQ